MYFNKNDGGCMKSLVYVAVGTAMLVSGCQGIGGVAPVKGSTASNSAPRTSNKAEVAQLRTSLAGEYIRENKLDAAQRQLEMAFQADSRFAPAYNMMGVLLQQEGSPSNIAKADGYFKRAIEIDPQLMQARNNYGVYLSELNRYQEAIVHFEVAGAALGYEGRLASLENLGRIYMKVGNTQKAYETFAKVLDADRNNLFARVEMVDVLAALGQTLKAKELYDDNVKLLYGEILPARMMFQGIQLAHNSGNRARMQALSQDLLSTYPLSDEARRLKAWIANPQMPLK